MSEFQRKVSAFIDNHPIVKLPNGKWQMIEQEPELQAHALEFRTRKAAERYRKHTAEMLYFI